MIVASQQLKFLHFIFCFISFKFLFYVYIVFISCVNIFFLHLFGIYYYNNIIYFICDVPLCSFAFKLSEKDETLCLLFQCVLLWQLVFIIHNICYFISTKATLISILLLSQIQTFMKFKSTWKMKVLVKIDWKTRF